MQKLFVFDAMIPCSILFGHDIFLLVLIKFMKCLFSVTK